MLERSDRYGHPSALGPRICIVGPGGAGKSILAAAIAQCLGLAPIHVDLLFHEPLTDWQSRPWHDYAALHSKAVAAETWVLEGNYILVDERLARATGVIWLDLSRWVCLFNYVRRTSPGGRRVGRLPGGHERFTRRMLSQILLGEPAERAKWQAALAALPVPVLSITSMRELNTLYRRWGLQRP